MRVVRHDVLGAGGDGRLKDHIVGWIAQEGAPKEMYLMPIRLAAQIIQYMLYVPSCERGLTNESHRGRFVLHRQRNREAHREHVAAQQHQQLVGSPLI